MNFFIKTASPKTYPLFNGLLILGFAFGPALWAAVDASLQGVKPAAAIPNVHLSPGVVTGGDGRLYVIGGLTADEKYVLSQVDIFDPVTNTWSEGTPLPSPRYQFSAVTAADGSIYVLGGYDGKKADFTSLVLRYDLTAKSWKEMPELTLQRNHFASVATPDGQIYAVGGEYRQYEWIDNVNFIDVFDPKANAGKGVWAVLNKKFTARNRLAAAVDHEGNIYAMGGMIMNYAPFPGSQKTVERFDPARNEWTSRAPMNEDRAEFATTTGLDGRIYAFGGMHGRYSPVCVAGCTFIVRRSAEVYDPRTDQWTTLPEMPVGRIVFGASTAPNGLIYVVGGMDGREAIKAMDVYVPATRTWIKGLAK